jgi:thioredoxin 1
VASDNVLTLTDDSFEQEIDQGKGLAVVDFWAEWCGPCRAVGPVIESIADDYAGKVKVGKVDVDSNRRITERFNVRSIPSILYFKDGALVETVVGVRSKRDLEELILAHA